MTNIPAQTYECSNCRTKIKLPENTKPNFEEKKCCDNPHYLLEILGNNGKKTFISFGKYLSYLNNGFIKPNEEGVEVLKIFEEKETKEEIKETLKDKKQIDFLIYDKNGDPEKVSIDKVADYLLEKFSFKTIFSTKSEVIYYYENGIWNKKGRGKIKAEIEKLLNNWSKNQVVIEIVEKIKRKTQIDEEEFNKTMEGIICLDNGVLNLKTKKLENHKSDYYFKAKIPLTYDEEKKCPKCKKFLEEILYEEDVNLMQEWFGFNLYNRYFMKKAVIAFGDPDTGKSITLNLLAAFIGERNQISLSLQKIAYGKSFDLLNLKDKYSNIHDDLSSKDLSEGGGFKMATGGGFIHGEEKFGDGIDFKTFAKHTFATNKIPSVKDIDDEAYYIRWLPIAFDNRIPEKEQDKDILEKLTTKDELSGLLNWAIEGLHRLIKNKKFSFNKTSKEVKEIMMRSGHPLSAFAQDCLEQENGNKITKEEMFNIYGGWCNSRGSARMSKEQLGRQLERFVPYIMAVREKVRVWKNVKFKDKIKETYDLDTLDTFKNTYRVLLEEYNDDNDDSKNNVYSKNKASEVTQTEIISDSTRNEGGNDNDQKLISSPNNYDNPPKKDYCGQDFEDLEIGEKFICGQMWKDDKRLKCPKCSEKEKTGNLEDLKEKCVKCGKVPATITQDGEKFYCEDCAKLLLREEGR